MNEHILLPLVHLLFLLRVSNFAHIRTRERERTLGLEGGQHPFWRDFVILENHKTYNSYKKEKMHLLSLHCYSKRLHFYLLFLIVFNNYTNAGYLTDKDDIDQQNLSNDGDDTYGKRYYYYMETEDIR